MMILDSEDHLQSAEVLDDFYGGKGQAKKCFQRMKSAGNLKGGNRKPSVIMAFGWISFFYYFILLSCG